MLVSLANGGRFLPLSKIQKKFFSIKGPVDFKLHRCL